MKLSNKNFYKYPILFVQNKLKKKTFKLNEKGFILTRYTVYMSSL